MRIPFARKATGLLRNLRAPMLHRRMVRSAVDAQPTSGSALIIAPHADDETFGCGGVIALKRKRGAAVTVVIVTDGAASHPDLDPAKLIPQRQAEARAATTHLGVPPSDLIFLNAPDGRLTHLPADQRDAIVGRLAALLIEKRPAEVYAPHFTDRHPDHEATNQMVRQAIAQTAGALPGVTLLEYPIWLLWWAPVTLPADQMHMDAARRIDVTDVAAQKNAAIAVYESQLPDMPKNFLAQFTGGFELFFERDLARDASA